MSGGYTTRENSGGTVRTAALSEISKWPLQWAEASSYADVRCYVDPRSGDDEPVVVKRINVGRMTVDIRAAAELINSSVQHFRNGLAQCNVPIINPYECTVDGDDVVHISGYGGKTVRNLMTGASTQDRRRYLSMVVDAMTGVLGQGDSPKIGIDARLSNFCHGREGVTYVDVFPALCVYDGTYMVHWPNPTDPAIVAKERRRKFDPYGIIRRLRFDVLEAGDSDEEDIRVAISDVMGTDEGGKMLGFLERLPDRAFAEAASSRKHEIIEALGPDDTDFAREIAIRLVPRDEHRMGRLKQLYVDTSSFAGHHGVDPSAGFRRAKDQLHAFVR